MYINPNNQFYDGGNTKFHSLIVQLIEEGRTQQVDPGDLLLSEGGRCDFFFYILSGSFRTFRYIDEKEVTIGFTFKGDMDTCPYSFYNNEPSKDTIEALSKGTVVKVYKDQFEQVAKKEGVYHDFLLYMYNTYIETLVLRSIDFRVETAETRYLKLLTIQPDEVRSIPLQYVASYLGISKERLSRIRKKHSELI